MKTVKIGIIDEDKVLIFLTRKMIKNYNPEIEVISCEEAADALSYLSHNQNNLDKLPDIILLDINLPIMDGWEFLEEYDKIVGSFPKKIKLYMFSSSISAIDKDRAIQNPLVEDYLIKPLTEEKLSKIINDVNSPLEM